MTDYAIGDVQGCYDSLCRLLDHLKYNEHTDRLWFVGDLVNRGSQSLAVLNLIRSLATPPLITLGNHDLHLLSLLFGNNKRKNHDDTLTEVINAPNALEIGHWLRKQSILHHDEQLNIVMCHAGIPPIWDLQEAKNYAEELENVLAGDHYISFFNEIYGNDPNYWSSSLTGIARYRAITNYFTRMRFCNAQGELLFTYKGTLANAPAHCIPWYAVPGRKPIHPDIVFGHWAALQGKSLPKIHALDTGCLWGEALTALCLQDKQRFSVPC